MPDPRLPIYVRWTLLALGGVARPGTARPICPVAHWLLDGQPHLAPPDPDPERLAAVRARTDQVDGLLLQIHDAAFARRRRLAVWTIGAGFDGRWARLAGPLAGSVARWVEVDEPAVAGLKDYLMPRSPFAGLWRRVQAIGAVPAGWGIEPRVGEQPVIVLEGALHRLSARGLRSLLRALAAQAPGAHCVLDLTGVHGMARTGWSARRLAPLGWTVVDDVEVAGRYGLTDALGRPVCAGMVPVRVVHLIARPPR